MPTRRIMFLAAKHNGGRPGSRLRSKHRPMDIPHSGQEPYIKTDRCKVSLASALVGRLALEMMYTPEVPQSAKPLTWSETTKHRTSQPAMQVPTYQCVGQVACVAGLYDTIDNY